MFNFMFNGSFVLVHKIRVIIVLLKVKDMNNMIVVILRKINLETFHFIVFESRVRSYKFLGLLFLFIFLRLLVSFYFL